MNIVALTGNITYDSELKYTTGGTAVLKFSIAVNEKYKDKEEVAFVECVMFGTAAEKLHQYLNKGTRLNVSGSLKQDSWTDQSGNKRSKLYVRVDKIDFIGCKGNNENTQGNATRQEPKVNVYSQSEAPAIDVDDGNIPF